MSAVRTWLTVAWLFIQWRAARLWRWIRRKPEPVYEVPVTELMSMTIMAAVALTILKSPAITDIIKSTGDGYANIFRTILDDSEKKR